ncbi:hypothetical protein [Ralstonia syzygii]|uniref:Uncharacterized protein n=1 Tax=Ralstonia syzygii R24 TaxID=907261 RepID=G3A7S5_9RALS|nr:hypothetical protein [Ralstonia syzygii]CCA86561.1 membrane hypothetical protein [Ralstonia syzygii R24]
MLDAKDSPVGNIAAAYELTLRQREFEISQLTQRNNFFMIFQGVIIGGLVQSSGQAAPVLTFAICGLGFAVSVWQMLMAAGAKFWQVRWERAARQLEVWLLEELKDHAKVFQVFSSDTKFLSGDDEKKLNEVNKTVSRQVDPLTMQPGQIKKWVEEELKNGAKWWQWPVSKLIIGKPSVSRIPIFVGAALAVFWLILLLHTLGWGVPSAENVLHLVPLKK